MALPIEIVNYFVVGAFVLGFVFASVIVRRK
jgi:hypothetical protein